MSDKMTNDKTTNSAEEFLDAHNGSGSEGGLGPFSRQGGAVPQKGLSSPRAFRQLGASCPSPSSLSNSMAKLRKEHSIVSSSSLFDNTIADAFAVGKNHASGSSERLFSRDGGETTDEDDTAVWMPTMPFHPTRAHKRLRVEGEVDGSPKGRDGSATSCPSLGGHFRSSSSSSQSLPCPQTALRLSSPHTSAVPPRAERQTSCHLRVEAELQSTRNQWGEIGGARRHFRVEAEPHVERPTCSGAGWRARRLTSDGGTEPVGLPHLCNARQRAMVPLDSSKIQPKAPCGDGRCGAIGEEWYCGQDEAEKDKENSSHSGSGHCAGERLQRVESRHRHLLEGDCSGGACKQNKEWKPTSGGSLPPSQSPNGSRKEGDVAQKVVHGDQQVAAETATLRAQLGGMVSGQRRLKSEEASEEEEDAFGQIMGLVATLRKECTCPICLCILQDPRVIQACQHAFCKPCIEEALKHKSECPTCRCKTTRRHLTDVEGSGTMLTVLQTFLSLPVILEAEAVERHLRERRLKRWWQDRSGQNRRSWEGRRGGGASPGKALRGERRNFGSKKKSDDCGLSNGGKRLSPNFLRSPFPREGRDGGGGVGCQEGAPRPLAVATQRAVEDKWNCGMECVEQPSSCAASTVVAATLGMNDAELGVEKEGSREAVLASQAACRQPQRGAEEVRLGAHPKGKGSPGESGGHVDGAETAVTSRKSSNAAAASFSKGDESFAEDIIVFPKGRLVEAEHGELLESNTRLFETAEESREDESAIAASSCNVGGDSPPLWMSSCGSASASSLEARLGKEKAAEESERGRGLAATAGAVSRQHLHGPGKAVSPPLGTDPQPKAAEGLRLNGRSTDPIDDESRKALFGGEGCDAVPLPPRELPLLPTASWEVVKGGEDNCRQADDGTPQVQADDLPAGCSSGQEGKREAHLDTTSQGAAPLSGLISLPPLPPQPTPLNTLAGSCLNNAQWESVERFASRFRFQVLKRKSGFVGIDFSHLVVSTLSSDSANRTPKYLTAVAAGRWIVGFDFVSECLRRRHLLDEERFAVTRDSRGGVGGCLRSRQSPGTLFKHCRFHVLYSDEQRRGEGEKCHKRCGPRGRANSSSSSSSSACNSPSRQSRGCCTSRSTQKGVIPRELLIHLIRLAGGTVVGEGGQMVVAPFPFFEGEEPHREAVRASEVMASVVEDQRAPAEGLEEVVEAKADDNTSHKVKKECCQSYPSHRQLPRNEEGCVLSSSSSFSGQAPNGSSTACLLLAPPPVPASEGASVAAPLNSCLPMESASTRDGKEAQLLQGEADCEAVPDVSKAERTTSRGALLLPRSEGERRQDGTAPRDESHCSATRSELQREVSLSDCPPRLDASPPPLGMGERSDSSDVEFVGVSDDSIGFLSKGRTDSNVCFDLQALHLTSQSRRVAEQAKGTRGNNCPKKQHRKRFPQPGGGGSSRRQLKLSDLNGGFFKRVSSGPDCELISAQYGGCPTARERGKSVSSDVCRTEWKLRDGKGFSSATADVSFNGQSGMEAFFEGGERSGIGSRESDYRSLRRVERQTAGRVDWTSRAHVTKNKTKNDNRTICSASQRRSKHGGILDFLLNGENWIPYGQSRSRGRRREPRAAIPLSLQTHDGDEGNVVTCDTKRLPLKTDDARWTSLQSDEVIILDDDGDDDDGNDDDDDDDDVRVGKEALCDDWRVEAACGELKRKSAKSSREGNSSPCSHLRLNCPRAASTASLGDVGVSGSMAADRCLDSTSEVVEEVAKECGVKWEEGPTAEGGHGSGLLRSERRVVNNNGSPHSGEDVGKASDLLPGCVEKGGRHQPSEPIRPKGEVDERTIDRSPSSKPKCSKRTSPSCEDTTTAVDGGEVAMQAALVSPKAEGDQVVERRLKEGHVVDATTTHDQLARLQRVSARVEKEQQQTSPLPGRQEGCSQREDTQHRLEKSCLWEWAEGQRLVERSTAQQFPPVIVVTDDPSVSDPNRPSVSVDWILMSLCNYRLMEIG